MSDEPAAAPSQEKGIVDETWEMLGSLKFAVVVLVLVAIASALGTVLVRDNIAARTPTEFAQTLESLEHDWGTARARLYMFSHAYDMWHSWWYRTLLTLLLLSSIVCTVNRLKATLRRFREPRVAVDRKAYRTLKGHVERTVRTPRSTCADTIAARLSKLRFAVFREESKTATDMLARSGGLSLFGGTLVHASLTICMIAALWGTSPSLGAWHTRIKVPEGGWAYLPEADLFVRCEQFSLRHTELDTGGYAVGDYKSRLSFFRPAEGTVSEAEVLVERDADTGAILRVVAAPSGAAGERPAPAGTEPLSLRKVGEGSTSVNHPAHAGGADLFQLDLDLEGARLHVTDPSGAVQEVHVPFSDAGGGMRGGSILMPVAIPLGPEVPADKASTAELPESIMPRDFATDFRNGMPTDAGTGTAPHPAIEFALIGGGTGTRTPTIESLGWVPEGGSVERSGWRITFDKTLYWTILDVRRQPGLWLLMTGFVIAGLGLVLAFWIPLHELRVKIEDSGPGCTVRVGAPAAFGGADAARLVQRVTECLPAADKGGGREEKR